MIRSAPIDTPGNVRTASVAARGGQVQPCIEEDIPQVANLHCRAFYGTDAPASERLRAYYRDVFFGNPWQDQELPSLVYRTSKGDVLGFMGLIPRTMLFHGRRIRVAIAHRLMVAPDSGHPLAAVKLMRRFLSGPQDVSISDGANDKGLQFWECSGGKTSAMYSMGWIWPLRPSHCLLSLLTRGQAGRLAGMAFRPICGLIDLVFSRKWRSSLELAPQTELERDMDASTILSCIAEVSDGYALRPEYDQRSMVWLWGRLQENASRGRLQGKALLDLHGRPAGGFLYYANRGGFGEVIFMAARRDSINSVLNSLFHHALKQRRIGLRGRIEPRFLLGLMQHGCILKKECCALVHSRDPEILEAIEHGDAFISGLEGELWLRSPKDRL